MVFEDTAVDSILYKRPHKNTLENAEEGWLLTKRNKMHHISFCLLLLSTRFYRRDVIRQKDKCDCIIDLDKVWAGIIIRKDLQWQE